MSCNVESLSNGKTQSILYTVKRGGEGPRSFEVWQNSFLSLGIFNFYEEGHRC